MDTATRNMLDLLKNVIIDTTKDIYTREEVISMLEDALQLKK